MTSDELKRAVSRAWGEYRAAGLMTRGLARTPFRLVLTDVSLDLAYGLYVHRTHPLARALGFRPDQIVLPVLSLQKLLDRLTGRRVTVLDTVRHEMAHALAYTSGRLVRGSPRFHEAFGAHHDRNAAAMYRKDCVSSYAMADPAEDFAETVAHWLRCRGKIGALQDRPQVRKKLEFVSSLPGLIRRHGLREARSTKPRFV